MTRKAKRESDGTPSLEARLLRLEEIVRDLEGGEVELERGLELFEEGVGHLRAAEKTLAEAELRVSELLGEGKDLREEEVDVPESGS